MPHIEIILYSSNLSGSDTLIGSSLVHKEEVDGIVLISEDDNKMHPPNNLQ